MYDGDDDVNGDVDGDDDDDEDDRRALIVTCPPLYASAGQANCAFITNKQPRRPETDQAVFLTLLIGERWTYN